MGGYAKAASRRAGPCSAEDALLCRQKLPNRRDRTFCVLEPAQFAGPGLLDVKFLVNADLLEAISGVGVPSMIFVFAVGTPAQQKLEGRLNDKELRSQRTSGSDRCEVQ